MAEAVVQAPVQGTPEGEGSAAPRRSTLRRFGTAIVLCIVFVLLLALSLWLYPRRAVVDRPAPLTLTMLSGRGPDVGAFDYMPLTAVPDPGYSDPSGVDVSVAPAGRDLYSVRVRWSYLPAMCTAGQQLEQSQGVGQGCAPTSAPYETVGSVLLVSLPTGATIPHCHACLPDHQVPLQEYDTKARPDPGLPDGSAAPTGTTPQAFPVTATWKFEVHATAFAWAANGLTAEASLPIVNFLNDGNAGYGNVAVTYRIPGGRNYDWDDGPDPDQLTWTEPVSSASAAVQVAGSDNRAADSDTRDVLIVGILLGTAGGALVGAIQEFAHAVSDTGDGGGSRRRRRRP